MPDDPQTTQTTQTSQQSQQAASNQNTQTSTTQTQQTAGQTKTQQTDAGAAGDKSLLTKEPEKGITPEPTKDGEKTDKGAAGAPEKYEAFKVPEGFELDSKVAEEAGTLFKDLNLSQEQGQKAVDFYVKNVQEAFQAPFRAYRDMRDGWIKDTKALPEIGGEIGQGKKVNVAISRMLNSFGDAKLATDFYNALDLTGAGDHPAVVQILYKAAQLLSEGSHVSGNGPSKFGASQPGQTQRPSAAQALYPKLPSGA